MSRVIIQFYITNTLCIIISCISSLYTFQYLSGKKSCGCFFISSPVVYYVLILYKFMYILNYYWKKLINLYCYTIHHKVIYILEILIKCNINIYNSFQLLLIPIFVLLPAPLPCPHIIAYHNNPT